MFFVVERKQFIFFLGALKGPYDQNKTKRVFISRVND